MSSSRSATFRTSAFSTALVCAGHLVSARPASAQPRPPAPTSTTPAADHFNEARALFDRGETASACRKFEQSYAEDAAPGTLYNLALCYEREGRIADAYRQLDDLASRAEAAGRADKAVGIRQRANALQPRLARVDLVHRADAVAGVTGLSIDGTVFLADLAKKPVYLAPGKHVIAIQHADGVTVTRTTEVLAAGKAQRIEMEDPAPEPASPLGPEASAPLVVHEGIVVNRRRRTAAYVTGGVGLALVAAGSALGIVAVVYKGKYQNLCGSGGTCPQSGDISTAYSDRDTAKVSATFATVGLAAGGAAVAAAVYLFISSRESRDERSGFLLAPASDGHGAGVQLGYRF